MVQSPNKVRVDLSALEHNLGEVRRLLHSGAKVMGVVKSDAYGHGLVPVSRVLAEKGVDCLGVAHLAEALELRGSGIGTPVVILCGVQSREEAARAVEEGFSAVLYNLDAAELLASEGQKRGKGVRVHVKVDTGMGRLGVPHEEVGPFLKRLRDYEGFIVEGLTSHLSSADEESSDYTAEQIARFRKAVAAGQVLGLDLPLNSLSNSAGVMKHPDAHFQMVRPGIMLYGGLPSPDFPSPASIRPVMGLEGKILQTREMPEGTPISYGRTHYTKGASRVAVLSVGYGDGLPRSLSNRGKVLIRGKRCDIIGRVCMNMVICDVTDLRGVSAGEEAVFLGTQGEETITGDEMARWAGTIAYEVFCSVGQRCCREYLP